MHPAITLLLLPYTRAELPRWGSLMKWAGVGWEAGQRAEWKSFPVAVTRGKQHGYLMKLDRSDWAQRMTYFVGRYYEIGVLRTLDALLRPGDRFVDVGSNIGMITLHARAIVGATGGIDCFEPNPECVAAIREHLRMNGIDNVVIHPCALAAARGLLSLHLTSDHTGTATLAEVADAEVRSMNVEVRVGDDEIGDAPRLIKIDVEGFELQVLEGFSRTLAVHKPFLIAELVGSLLARAGTGVAEVSEFLFDRGYEAFGIHTERKRLRTQERLALRPLARGSDFGESTDVLWCHTTRRQELPGRAIKTIASLPS